MILYLTHWYLVQADVFIMFVGSEIFIKFNKRRKVGGKEGKGGGGGGWNFKISVNTGNE